MQRGFFATIKTLIILIAFSACSKNEDLSTPEEEKVYISIVFTPEGFCNMGYNDLSLQAIEKHSQKYGYTYSFSVPKTIEDGMAYYNTWCNTEIDNNTRCLFIFASNIYKDLLANATHPPAGTRKDVLIYEVEEELPYAYSFFITYYGAAYMIGSWYLNRYPSDFQIIAANPYLKGLNYVVDGLKAATDEFQRGSVYVSYIDESPDGGLDDDDKAYNACIEAYYNSDNISNIFIPYAGSSNLGVYRFSDTYLQEAVGIDFVSPNIYMSIILCMNKRMDLALDDFLSVWMKGKTPPRHKFYTLESGRAVVDRHYLMDNQDKLFEQAVAKEKEYFSRHEKNE